MRMIPNSASFALPTASEDRPDIAQALYQSHVSDNGHREYSDQHELMPHEGPWELDATHSDTSPAHRTWAHTQPSGGTQGFEADAPDSPLLIWTDTGHVSEEFSAPRHPATSTGAAPSDENTARTDMPATHHGTIASDLHAQRLQGALKKRAPSSSEAEPPTKRVPKLRPEWQHIIHQEWVSRNEESISSIRPRGKQTTATSSDPSTSPSEVSSESESIQPRASTKWPAEFKARALKLVQQLGSQARAARQLDISTRILRNWVDATKQKAADRQGSPSSAPANNRTWTLRKPTAGLPASIPARKEKVVSQEFREDTLELVKKIGNQTTVAKQVGINPRTLRRWIETARKKRTHDFPRIHAPRSKRVQSAAPRDVQQQADALPLKSRTRSKGTRHEPG